MFFKSKGGSNKSLFERLVVVDPGVQGREEERAAAEPAAEQAPSMVGMGVEEVILRELPNEEAERRARVSAAFPGDAKRESKAFFETLGQAKGSIEDTREEVISMASGPKVISIRMETGEATEAEGGMADFEPSGEEKTYSLSKEDLEKGEEIWRKFALGIDDAPAAGETIEEAPAQHEQAMEEEIPEDMPVFITVSSAPDPDLPPEVREPEYAEPEPAAFQGPEEESSPAEEEPQSPAEQEPAVERVIVDEPVAVAEDPRTGETVEIRQVSVYERALFPEQYFYAKDGRVIKNFPQLYVALNTMDDETFEHHAASRGVNDFASWVRGVFEHHECAERLDAAKDRKEMLALVAEYL